MESSNIHSNPFIHFHSLFDEVHTHHNSLTYPLVPLEWADSSWTALLETIEINSIIALDGDYLIISHRERNWKRQRERKKGNYWILSWLLCITMLLEVWQFIFICSHHSIAESSARIIKIRQNVCGNVLELYRCSRWEGRRMASALIGISQLRRGASIEAMDPSTLILNIPLHKYLIKLITSD